MAVYNLQRSQLKFKDTNSLKVKRWGTYKGQIGTILRAEPAMVVHGCNLIMCEAEAGGLPQV